MGLGCKMNSLGAAVEAVALDLRGVVASVVGADSWVLAVSRRNVVRIELDMSSTRSSVRP